jgi:hypothetical protein
VFIINLRIFKNIKNTIKISAVLLLALFLFVSASIGALQFANVQTWLTQKVAAYLSVKLNAKVEIGRVDIDFLKTLVLQDLYIQDLHQDTLLYAEKIGAEISIFSVGQKHLIFNKISLEGTSFNLKTYEQENMLNLQFIIDSFSGSDTTQNTPWMFGIEELEVKNGTFKYHDFNANRIKEGIDFNHLEAHKINILLHDIIFAGDTIMTKIKNISLMEISGFELSELSGNAAISSSELLIKKLNVKTPHSDIKTKLTFQYDEWKDYRHFNTNVRMKFNVNHSIIHFSDIAYFAPDLIGIDKVVTLKGNVRGTVENLKGKDISLAFGDHTRFRGDVNIKGLPVVEETYLHLAINQLTTTKKDLERIPLPPFKEGKNIQTPDNINLLGLIRFTGDFSGFFNDFVAYGDFKTNLGMFSSDIALKYDNNSGKTRYEGKLTTHYFDVGKFLDVREIGSVSLSAQVSGKGFTKEELNASLKGQVKHFDFNRYHYKNIDVEGKIANRLFIGSLDVKDENINLLFDGSIDFTKDLPAFAFNADIKNARPVKLNVINRDSSSTLSSKMFFDLSGNSLDNMIGEIKVENFYYSENANTYYINKINFSSHYDDQIKILKLQSDLADARIEGKFNIEHMLSSVFDLVEKTLIPEKEFKSRSSQEKVQDFEFDFHLKNIKPLTELFLPNFNVDQNTRISGQFNSAQQFLSIKGNSPLLDVYGVELKNLNINSSINNSLVKTNITSSGLFITDSICLSKFSLRTKAQGNELGFNISWKNDNIDKNEADINGSIAFSSLQKFDVKIEPSTIYMADSLWQSTTNNIVHFDTSAITIDNLGLFTASQSVLVKGKITEVQEEPLQVLFNDFNLGNLNFASEKLGINLQGIINGNAQVSNMYSNLLINTSLDVKKFVINNEVIGNGIITSDWNTRKESIGIDAKFFRGNIPTLDISGNYYPKKEKNNLDLIVKLEKLQLQMIDKYLEGLVSDLKGWANGEIRLKGEPAKPLFYGKINIQKAGFLIDFLNTSYSFTHDIYIEPDRFYFNQLTLFDIRGNKSNAFGIVTHNNFKDFFFDIQLEPQNFMALNTQAHHNPLYYGTAFMSGRVAIKGMLDKLNIDITAQSEKGTAFNIPLSGTEEITENKFITFINKDSSAVKTRNNYKVDLSGIQMKFELDVTPETEMQLIFDPKIGDVMKGRGNGHLTMEINTLGNFSIFGEYIIEEGDYLFTLLNVINKRFKVEKGGSIRWTGNPYHAQLDMNAIYRLRTSLYDLASDIDTNSTRRRVPVSVVLNLKNDLLKPDILFDIKFPGLTDEIMKSQIRSILTSSKEEMNQQVFALLTLNRFVTPINQMSGTRVQHAGATATNSTEMLSNQLSNWLSQISNDFDIGVKYRPGDEITPQELEVALSTQLFNDRVIIDGNVGVANNQQAAQSGNALLGDFNIEYKISNDGRFRVKAFNRTNNYNQLFVNSPFTQGVGIFYRVEFNTFDDLKNKYFGWLRKRDPHTEFEPRYDDNDLDFETDEENVL